jgi:zinc protease
MTRIAGSAWLVVALASVLTACATYTAPAPLAPGATAGAARPTREVLGNGVVLITQEHRAADVVALQMWMRVGGRDEAPNELGLSHYLEHMLFKGTPSRPPGSIDREIEGLGGSSNAFTSYDFTHYDIVVPAAAVKPALELLADIAVNAAFVPEELEAEKKVVFEEMNLTEDDPRSSWAGACQRWPIAGHPYGRPILGTRELIQALDRTRLDAYYKKQYVPQNMTLVVIGPMTAAQVRPLAAGDLRPPDRAGGAKRAMPPLPSMAGGRRDDLPRPEQQAYLGLAWYAAATALAAEDIPAVDLLSYILGDGPSSRLNQTVREQKNLVFAIEATYVTREQSGTVSVTARCDPKNSTPPRPPSWT